MAAPKKMKIVEVANKIAHEKKCDVFLLNGDMSYFSYIKVREQFTWRKSKNEKLLFILVTYGGSLDVAYRVARLIQNNYSSSSSLIIGPCKSAGTLCVCGSNEVVVSDVGELGPLDVQVLREDDIASRESGLVVKESIQQLQEQALSIFNKISFDLKGKGISYSKASEIAVNITKSIISPISEQINPLRLGEYERYLRIASKYGERLEKNSKNLKKDCLSRLVTGYPDHGFVIDRDEAKELFHKVRDLDEYELELVENFAEHVFEPVSDRMIFYINGEPVPSE
ncbi:hypothetical protein QET93_011500 [Akkermansia sp. N21116]|uniref:hypothetical protein n=1 Tax=Akkermansia sp. N21116 TaxID=3040764 RepID=UPI00244EFDC3|nr:hypothetical protein [Akkermansia sp. N21116]WPX40158.1 hypothetical protein QET93_011500 [Akkermansia sp. N21116]